MAEVSLRVRQFCTFEVDSLFLGIDVLDVQEVMKSRDLAPVPLAHDAVQGLLNLRGQIVTAIDLRRRLALPSRPADQRPMLVVARTEGGAVAFLVDAIGDVIDVPEDTYEDPPDTLRPAMRELITGVYKLPKRLLHVLSAERAADVGR